jgi:hypothetical protein
MPLVQQKLTHSGERGRQHMPLKQWYLSAELHGIISQCRAFFISTLVQLNEYWSLTPLIISDNHGFNIKKSQNRLFPRQLQMVLRISNDGPNFPDLIS